MLLIKSGGEHNKHVRDSAMSDISLRPKRRRECDTNHGEIEDDHILSSPFTQKRICTQPINAVNVNEPSQTEIQNKNSNKSGKETREEDMEVCDDIVSTFNTISFDASTASKCSQTFPVFAPLRRAGRKIDHLVDDVIRKASRLNASNLRLSIPSSDFEFSMPSHVDMCGSPCTDSRYISSPEYRNMAMIAVRDATTFPPMSNKPSLIHSRSNARMPRFGSPSCEHGHDQSTLFHLGNVTHSDWFDNSCTGEEHAAADIDNADDEEDCEDMDMDT